MYEMNRIFSIIPMVMLVASCSSPKQRAEKSEDPYRSKVDSVLSLMTTAEKIGQMTLFTSDWDVTGPTIRSGYKQDIKDGKVGAIFNAYGVEYVRKLQQMAVDCTRMKIPLMFGYDVVHGYKTIFPIPLGQSASWDLDAIERSERIAAIEASAEGLNWTFAPMVDIARDPRWGRIAEGAGEDPCLGSRIAATRVHGFQGEDLAENNTLVACAKHFAAYGAAIAGRDYNTVDISDRTLREIYLPPFKAAVDAGVGTIMTAFNELNGVPASGNKYLIRDILKDDWNFEGFVVTDYTSIMEMVKHGIVANDKQAGELALNAGVDMDMQSAIYDEYLKQSLDQGKVSMEEIDDAVRRILRIKFMLGLFDDPYKYLDQQREKNLVMSQDHLDFARDFAARSMVLLKNDKQLLPIAKNTASIAVIGPLADSRRDMIGSWSAAGDYKKSVTLLEGIKNVLPSAQVNYAKGCDINSDDKSGFGKAAAIARRSSLVVLALGESASMSGEAASRSSIRLPGVQEDLVRVLLKTGKPLVVVLMNGRPLDLSWLDENVPAIIEAWFPGTQAGNAIADVLSGNYNPSGKLTVSYPRNIGQVPLFYNHKNTGRPFSGDKYTSKYLDVANTPLYPFGYGLSYTTFAYSDLEISDTVMQKNQSLTVSVMVKNTGEYAGNEVVQLYIRDVVGSVTRPVKELKGFRKIYLEPGQSQQVSFAIKSADLEMLDENMQPVVEPGDFVVFVGRNSQELLQAKFTVTD